MQDGWADSRGQFVATDEGKLDTRSAGRLCMRTGRAVRRPLYHKSKSGICPPRLVHCQSRPEQPRPSSAAPCACWLFVRCGSACFDGETGPQQRHQRPALQLRALRDEHRREQAKAAISSSAVTQKVTPGRGAAERGSGGRGGPLTGQSARWSTTVHHGGPRRQFWLLCWLHPVGAGLTGRIHPRSGLGEQKWWLESVTECTRTLSYTEL